MSTIKTVATKASVTKFINAVEDETKRNDSKVLRALHEEITGEPAVMWGDSIIGFGKYHYKSERSSQEGDWPIAAFSPRKQNLTIYIMPGFRTYKHYIDKLGKCKTTVSCLYVKRLSDIDMDVLRQLITDSVTYWRAKYNV